MIIGGKSKGLDLTDLCHKIASESKITSVYLFGSERKNVNKLLKQSGYKGKIEMSANLDDVFIKLNIKNVANVLFSPSFASFDQYKNYKERGEHFNKLFRNL